MTLKMATLALIKAKEASNYYIFVLRMNLNWVKYPFAPKIASIYLLINRCYYNLNFKLVIDLNGQMYLLDLHF